MGKSSRQKSKGRRNRLVFKCRGRSNHVGTNLGEPGRAKGDYNESHNLWNHSFCHCDTGPGWVITKSTFCKVDRPLLCSKNNHNRLCFQMGLSVDIEHYLAAQWLLMFIKTVHIILYLFAFWYTYEDSIIKSVLISISGELLALAISRGSIILLQNLGSGIEDMYSRPFGWRTVLLCLLCFAMFFCIRFLVGHFAEKRSPDLEIRN